MRKLLLLLWIVPLFGFGQGKTISFQKNMKIFNGQESSYFLNTSSTAQTKSGQLTLSDSLKISLLGTSNTTVLTPDSNGKVDTLETVDGTTITYDTMSIDFADITNDLDVGDTIEFDNGLQIYNTHADTGYIEETVTKIEGDLVVTGCINLAGGTRLGAYVPEDSTLTTAVDVDTWKFLGDGDNSKFINIHSSDDFGFCGDTLCYTGTPTIYLHIEYGGGVSCNTVNETVHISIFINDVEAEQLTSATFCTSADAKYPIAGISNIIQVSTNDEIKIMIKSDSATTITNAHFSICAIKID